MTRLNKPPPPAPIVAAASTPCPVTLTSGATVSDKQVVTFAVGDMDPKTLLPTTTTGCANGGATADTAASRLASTGASIMAPLAVGAALVLLGGSLLVVLRRRRDESLMTDKQQTDYRGAFDAAAADFTALGRHLWNPIGAATVAVARSKPGDGVLDACCGAGASAIPAARAGWCR